MSWLWSTDGEGEIDEVIEGIKMGFKGREADGVVCGPRTMDDVC